MKRLDIICKSKGLARPKRDGVLLSQTRGTYVSPYSRAKASPAGSLTRSNQGSKPRVPNSDLNLGTRGASIGSSGKPTNKYVNTNYTPPNRKPISFRSPSLGGNSNGSGAKTTEITMQNQNRLRRGPALQHSPSMASDNSRKSIGVKSSGYGKAPEQKQFNRVYTPNGGSRTSTNLDGSGNRIRRESAVVGAINAHNP